MRHLHRAYGLNISSNRHVPYLTESDDAASVDVLVVFHDIDPSEVISAGDGWGFGFPTSNGPLVGVDVFDRPKQHKLRFYHPAGEFLEFVVSAGTVDVFVPDGIAQGDAVSFLIGPVLAVVCRMRQIPCLHASVLTIDDRAFALMGGKGAGKSTTAAMLRTMGAGLLTDDVAVMHRGGDGHISVQPGYPHMRLTHDAARICHRSFSQDSLVLSTGAKCYVPAYSDDVASRFPTGPVHLDRVYLLSTREPAIECSIETVDHAQALRELNRHAYVRYVTNESIRKKDFELFADLARLGSVRATNRPDDLAMLELFCEQLLQEFAG